MVVYTVQFAKLDDASQPCRVLGLSFLLSVLAEQKPPVRASLQRVSGLQSSWVWGS